MLLFSESKASEQSATANLGHYCAQVWLSQLSAEITHPKYPEGLQLTLQHNLLQVDHIIPQALGGIDHPSNYTLMYQPINAWFGGFFSREKQHYVGKDIVDQVKAAHQQLWKPGEKQASKSAVKFSQWPRGQHALNLTLKTVAFDQRTLQVSLKGCFVAHCYDNRRVLR